MILITGATGFVGRRLVARLTHDAKLQARILLRPGADVSRLPRPLSVHTMVGNVTDSESLLAALNGVHTIIHLVGAEFRGQHAGHAETDVAGAKALVAAALGARVGRIICLSRPGADRASGYPMLKAKGEIEEIIRACGIAYTIFRSAPLFGDGDSFSENLAMLISSFPFFIVPGDGEAMFQPLWVEDLVTCILIALENLDTLDSVISLGGPELLSYRRMAMRVMHTIGVRRPIVGVPFLVNQAAIWFLDGLFARWPINLQWVEMLASSSIAELGSVERQFGFRPASFDIGLLSQYMKGRHYTARMAKHIFTSG